MRVQFRIKKVEFTDRSHLWRGTCGGCNTVLTSPCSLEIHQQAKLHLKRRHRGGTIVYDTYRMEV